MNYYIPLNYNLHLYDVYNKIDYNYDNKIIIINNFKLYINDDNLIYKITSDIELEYLLDFLFNYKNKTIKKIYYFLILKHLSNRTIKIKTEHNYCCFYKKNKYDEIILIDNYLFCNNDKDIILISILSKVYLIINNKTINKSLICQFNDNYDINYLIDNMTYIHKNNYEDINIYIIGDNDNISINIYHILIKK